MLEINFIDGLIIGLSILLLLLIFVPETSDDLVEKKSEIEHQESTLTAPEPVLTKPAIERKALVGRAYIIDGDSIVIQKMQIRLFGVDAPEINHPYGQKSKWALFRLCKGQVIRAEFDHEDAYGRTVARCFLPDGRDLSAEMVKLGLAIDWAKYSGGEYRELELPNIRRKLWLADARQKGHMHVWKKFDARHATLARMAAS